MNTPHAQRKTFWLVHETRGDGTWLISSGLDRSAMENIIQTYREDPTRSQRLYDLESMEATQDEIDALWQEQAKNRAPSE